MTRISRLTTHSKSPYRIHLKTRTEARSIRSASETEKGFSLIEMIVVVALIAVISIFALPSITSYFQVSLNSASRELATTIKETYNGAVVTGKVHRIVYDIKNGQYWAESGPPTILLETKETKEREERRKRFNKDEPAPSSPFTLEKSITRKKVTLSNGVSFEDIITQQSNEPITDGMAYTHFFPHGLTERTIIHLKDTANHHYTLVVQPVIGQSDVWESYKTGAEINGK